MSTKEPYREPSNVPIYFEPPLTAKITLDEAKAASSAIEFWRGCQVILFIVTSLCLWAVSYGVAVGDKQFLAGLGPAAFLIFGFFYAGRNAKFHRNIILQYKRQ